MTPSKSVKHWLQSIKLQLRLMNRRRLHRRQARNHLSYVNWVRQYDLLTPEVLDALHDRLRALKATPKIALVMPVFNSNLSWLQEAIDSVKRQIYRNWELCIADDASTDPAVKRLIEAEAAQDPRIKVILRSHNGHICEASNSALGMVTAEYTGLIDHDDILREHALLLMAETIGQWPNAQVIYSDEDKLAIDNTRCQPHFKSDWNPELLLSQNYFCHLTVYRTSLIRQAGGFRPGFEGAQDHDLALRCVHGLNPDQIIHIPHILYHWRQHDESTATTRSAKPYAATAGLRAVQDHLHRSGIHAVVDIDEWGWYRLRFSPIHPPPLVSIIIPTRNGLELLQTCINSVLEKTTHSAYEIIIVDNGSDEPAVLRYLNEISQDERISILRDDGPFNYSALNNAAVARARGEYVVLLNNDIEVISPGWLEEMIGACNLPGVGVVGSRLWYGDWTLQHGGVILGIGDVAGHAHKRLLRGQTGYWGRAQVLQSFSAVTAACLLVRKSVYQQVNGMDETAFAVAFSDVDFCLRLHQLGYRSVWTPHAELFHHESVTRGSDRLTKNRARYDRELENMLQRWGHVLKSDPAYNPNLSVEHETFALASPPRVSLKSPWYRQCSQGLRDK